MINYTLAWKWSICKRYWYWERVVVINLINDVCKLLSCNTWVGTHISLHYNNIEQRIWETRPGAVGDKPNSPTFLKPFTVMYMACFGHFLDDISMDRICFVIHWLFGIPKKPFGKISHCWRRQTSQFFYHITGAPRIGLINLHLLGVEIWSPFSC